jgi:dTDP-4-dehydrorhamnose reductase
VRFEHDTEGREAKQLENLADPGPYRRTAMPRMVTTRPVLITGSTGTLGQAFVRGCQRRGLPYVATDRTRLRLEDSDSIRATMAEVQPYAVLNAAGWSSIDGAEDHVHACMDANAFGPERLANACKLRDIPLITFSSDMVFDGNKGSAYVETDSCNPLNTYGRSKAEGERRVVTAGGRNLIVRSATYFSPYDSSNFAVRILNDLGEGIKIPEAGDCFFSPTYVPDLVDAVLDLLIDGETGIWHITNPARLSWAEFASTLAEHAGLDPGGVRVLSSQEMGWRAMRPVDVSLSSTRGGLLSETLPAIDRFIADTRHATKKKTPHPSPSLRDPVLTSASG